MLDDADMKYSARAPVWSPSIRYGTRDNSHLGPLSSRTLLLAFLNSVIVCTLTIHYIFGNIIPWHYTILAITISLPMAIVGIRSLAETDHNPESALGMFHKTWKDIADIVRLVSQLLFASLMSRFNPNAIIINLLSAGIA